MLGEKKGEVCCQKCWEHPQRWVGLLNITVVWLSGMDTVSILQTFKPWTHWLSWSPLLYVPASSDEGRHFLGNKDCASPRLTTYPEGLPEESMLCWEKKGSGRPVIWSLPWGAKVLRALVQHPVNQIFPPIFFFLIEYNVHTMKCTDHKCSVRWVVTLSVSSIHHPYPA